MRTITFEGKKINFDFSLGCINDVYVKELGGDFNDIINMQDHENNPSKLIEITRDIMLSGHIYWLYCNSQEEQGDFLLDHIRSSRMIATKWLMQETVINVVEWISNDLMPSNLAKPQSSDSLKKRSNSLG